MDVALGSTFTDLGATFSDNYDAEKITLDLKNFTITPLCSGEHIITATVGDMSATLTVKATNSMSEGYLATFDDESWLDIVSEPTSYYFEGGANYEIIDNFQGENGVLKVTGKINQYNGSGLIKFALPEAHSGKYTIKFWIAETELNPGLIGFWHKGGTPSDRIEGSYWYGSGVPANGMWHTKVVETSEDTSAVYFEAGNGVNAYLEIYFAFIMDGDIEDTAK